MIWFAPVSGHCLYYFTFIYARGRIAPRTPSKISFGPSMMNCFFAEYYELKFVTLIELYSTGRNDDFSQHIDNSF